MKKDGYAESTIKVTGKRLRMMAKTEDLDDYNAGFRVDQAAIGEHEIYYTMPDITPYITKMRAQKKKRKEIRKVEKDG